jgi:hypothetical protein
MRRLLGRRLRSIEVPTRELVVEPVSGVLGSRGVRLVEADGRSVIFWSFEANRVLDALTEHGAALGARKTLV